MPEDSNKSNSHNTADESSIKGAPELPNGSGKTEDKNSSTVPVRHVKAESAEVKKEEPEDPKTAEAVDDIVRHEGDELLNVEDSKQTAVPKKRWYHVFKKKKVFIPLITLLVLVALAAIPQTRYPIFGLFWKQNYKVLVVDSQTHQPVTEAVVGLDGETTTTNNQGKATLKVSVGHRSITISKKYYKTLNEKVLVPLHVSSTVSYSLQATGRQVPVVVVNKITGAPLSNALVKAADTEVRTDKNGKANLVLPADKTSVDGSITASGYNAAKITVQVTTKAVTANTFTLTPAGRVYFLSNATGPINVVSANLDGTDRQTVVTGTGNENPNDTLLFTTRDWKYLALLSQRSGVAPSLYLITTSNNKLSVMDSGNASFMPIGWYNHYFLYEVVRNDVPVTQSGHEVLKSYNADTGQIAVLDQNQTAQNNTDNFYTDFSNFNVMNNELTYIVQWYPTPGSINSGLTTEQDSLRTVQPGGQNKQDQKTFPANQTGYLQAKLSSPNNLYISDYSSSGSSTYYSFDGSSVKTANISDSTYNQAYPTYLLSPSGSQTFWGEQRDGKNTLFIGNQNGANQRQIASLSDYQAYGWYSDNYILVSKGGSELYVTSPNSLSSGKAPIKVTDYFAMRQGYGSYTGM